MNQSETILKKSSITRGGPLNLADRLHTTGLRGVMNGIGPGAVFMLTMCYLFAPEFYLKWVLNEQEREYQVVELVTFGTAFTASVLLGIWLWRMWKQEGRAALYGLATVGVIALATFFFAGEEVSWGQTYLGWKTPETMREFSHETNIHNSSLPIQALGSVFLVVMFFVLPAVWALGKRFGWKIPASMEPAIAEGPVIVCMAFAFGWKETKSLYRWLNPDYETRAVYIDFFEQINEHKEMLVAVSLLMYAVLRFRRRVFEG